MACERCRKDDGRETTEYRVTKPGGTYNRTLCGECAAAVAAVYEVTRTSGGPPEAPEAEAAVAEPDPEAQEAEATEERAAPRRKRGN
jgi:hypothetical protein